MMWLRNILFVMTLCTTLTAARAQEPVERQDAGHGVPGVGLSQDPAAVGTAVTRKPFTTLPGEAPQQPALSADSAMRRIMSTMPIRYYPSVYPRGGADFSRNVFFYDYSSGGDIMRWKGGAIVGSGSRTTLPGLLSRQNASLQMVHTTRQPDAHGRRDGRPLYAHARPADRLRHQRLGNIQFQRESFAYGLRPFLQHLTVRVDGCHALYWQLGLRRIHKLHGRTVRNRPWCGTGVRPIPAPLDHRTHCDTCGELRPRHSGGAACWVARERCA